MKIKKFLTYCNNDVIIGFYGKNNGTEHENFIEEIKLKNRDYKTTKNFIKHIKKKYPDHFIDGFWAYDDDTIAVHCTVIDKKEENHGRQTENT